MNSINNGNGKALGLQKFATPVVVEPKDPIPVAPTRVSDTSPEKKTTSVTTIQRIYTENTSTAFDPRVGDLASAIESLLGKLGEQVDATTSLADQVNALSARLDEGVKTTGSVSPSAAPSQSLRGATINVSLGGLFGGGSSSGATLGRIASGASTFAGLNFNDFEDLLSSSLASSQIRNLVGNRDASTSFDFEV